MSTPRDAAAATGAPLSSVWADNALLRVNELTVANARAGRTLLDGVSFSVDAGRTVGIVGPSGAGKTTLALAIAGLLPRGTAMTGASSIHFETHELRHLDGEAMRALRGRRIGYVFQEPALALDPAMRIGEQIAEAAIVHGVDRREARERAVAMLAKVGFHDAARAAQRHPHELSGGMRQRALIASAMLLAPALLIADEPTTALDPTIQAQVLDLIDALRAECGTTLLLVSHDLATVAERCERVITIDGGRVVDDAGATAAVSVWRARRPAPVARPDAVRSGAPLLEARGLAVRYATPALLPFPRRAAAPVTAVAGLDLTVGRGEIVALVGESGCGKTSAAHALLRLVEPDAGTVRFDGLDVRALDAEGLRRLRRRMQLVPQDAGASLTPHLTCEALVAEAMEVHGIASGGAARSEARVLLGELGLPTRAAGVRPRELSSGERQRVAIARALATDPDLLVCDEPLASVDEAARERVLGVLADRRARRGLAVLLISHDLEAVRRLADAVLVMYLGRVVESSRGTVALTDPRMPYTAALVAALPGTDAATRRARLPLPEAGDPGDVTRGCAFAPRCPHPGKDARCRDARPALAPLGGPAAQHAACWLAGAARPD